MAYRNRKQYLICYDICDTRRLARIHRYLTRQAIPVQKSVFHAILTNGKFSEIKEALNGMINEKQDDIRIYPLPEKPCVDTMGQCQFPEGIAMLDGENDILLTENRTVTMRER